MNLNDNQKTVLIDLPLACLKNKKVSVVALGEPHLVILEKDIDEIDLKKMGYEINSYKKLFPKNINVTLVSIIDKHTIKIKIFERGCFDETDACGTGAACAALVGRTIHGTEDSVDVQTKGGLLNVTINPMNEAILSGTPEKVFNGIINV